jgi:hypothetical protein
MCPDLGQSVPLSGLFHSELEDERPCFWNYVNEDYQQPFFLHHLPAVGNNEANMVRWVEGTDGELL